MAAAEQVPTAFAHIDSELVMLHDHKDEWATLPLAQKVEMLEGLRRRTAEVAHRWVDEACDAKGIPANSPATGEEWSSGPWAMIYGVDHLERTLDAMVNGLDPLAGAKIRTRPDGQVLVKVHPADIFDSLLLHGVEAEVWMQPEVTRGNLSEHMGSFYKEDAPEGKVALVLGAGNIASIAPLDMLYKLYAEGQVCMLKMNPVNDYLGPIFEEIFEEFVERGYVTFAYGGIEVGKYLTYHQHVDEIHVTGSERTFNAIVFGTGDDAAERLKNDDPLNPRRVTSELGGVGPTIVVPGPWSKADIKFQAEHVVTQKVHNGGFNCIAAQVLILPETWDKKEPFLRVLRDTMMSLTPRTPYYPGALDRVKLATEAHANVEIFDESRALLTNIDPEDSDAYAFENEFFCGVLAQTALPGDDAETFLRNAVAFANDRLHGTLGANIIIHPKTVKALGSKFEDIVADLEYGTIGINAWAGVGFLMARATWGAHPGHTRDDIESGIGVVHNALLFDKPQKTVVRAPFRAFPASFVNGERTLLPRPPWFATNPMAHEVMRRVTLFSEKKSWKDVPGIFAAALRG